MCSVFLPWTSPVTAADAYSLAREQMVEAIKSNVRDTRHYLDKEARDPRVMQVMGKQAIRPDSSRVETRFFETEWVFLGGQVQFSSGPVSGLYYTKTPAKSQFLFR